MLEIGSQFKTVVEKTGQIRMRVDCIRSDVSGNQPAFFPQ